MNSPSVTHAFLGKLKFKNELRILDKNSALSYLNFLSLFFCLETK